MTYSTKQKDLIMDYIKAQNHEFTINDIYEGLNKKVGLTTIYRFIDNLVDTGEISKNIGSNNTTYYQYLGKCSEENHFYLKCDKCGSLQHIDCDCICELSSHIIDKHKFKLNKENIIINGMCFECSKKI